MLTKSACCLAAVMAVAIPLLTHEAHGQATQYGRVNIGNGYVGASGGVIIPDKLHGTFSGAVAGSGDLSFKTGAAGTGFVGYHLNNYLAVEGQGGFAAFDEDSFSGTLNGVTGSASINGRVSAVIGLGNVIVTPFGRSGFVPYFGAGAGYASFKEKVNSIGGIAVNTTNTDSGAAADGILGFDAAVSARWSIGARYQFLWVFIGSTTTSNGVTTKQDDFTAHLITVTAAFHF